MTTVSMLSVTAAEPVVNLARAEKGKMETAWSVDDDTPRDILARSELRWAVSERFRLQCSVAPDEDTTDGTELELSFEFRYRFR